MRGRCVKVILCNNECLVFDISGILVKVDEIMELHQTEIGSCDKSLAVEDCNSGAHAKYWVAALVKMNSEKKVGSELCKLGYHNYVPTQIEVRQWSDRKKKVERVVIPMTIFVLVDREEESILRKNSSIYKFISYPGQKEAARIPNEQIQKLKFMLHNADSTVEFSADVVYEVGEEVEIVRGPLKGLYGELCYTDKGNPMLGIYVKLLGYSYVSVNITDVKRKT